MLDRRDAARLLVKFCGLLIVLSAVTSLSAAVDLFALQLRTLENYHTDANAQVLTTLAMLRFGPSFNLGIGILLILRREGIATLRRRVPEWVGRARRWPA